MAKGAVERARLLGLARDYVLEHGFVGLSLSELARAIGSNNRMLLYYFGSLHGILDEVGEEIIGGDRVVRAMDPNRNLLNEASIAEQLIFAWERVSDPQSLPHLRFFFTRFGTASDAPARYEDFLRRTQDDWTEQIADVLRRSPAVVEARAKAMAVVALWRGLQMQLICGESRSVVNEVHSSTLHAMLAAWKIDQVASSSSSSVD